MNGQACGRPRRGPTAWLSTALAVAAVSGCGSELQRATQAPPASCNPAAAAPSPAAGSPWTPVAADLPAAFGAQASVGATAAGIFAAGTDQVLKLDIASAAWKAVGTVPRRRPSFTLAVGKDGLLYLIGGPGRPGSTVGASSDVDAFNPGTGVWTTPAPLSVERNFAAAAGGRDGRIYVFGGYGGDGNPLATAAAYSPVSDAWTPIAPMPGPGAEQLAIGGADGRMYVIGSSASGAGTVARVYDPTSDSWTELPPLPVRRTQGGVTSLSDGRIVVLGGRDASSDVADTVEVFDPTARTWGTLPSMTRPRAIPGAVVGSDGRVYAIGGDVGSVAAAGCPLVGTVEAARL